MRKLTIYKALARGVVLESVRRKDMWVIAILGFLILVSAGTLGIFGFQGLEIFAKDLAVTVLGMFSTVAAILTASRMLPEEIKNRTLYPLLARPITRMDLIVGKFLGSVAVSWAAFLILAILTAGALAMFRVQFEPIMLQYMLCKMMGLVVVCAVSVTLSSFMTPAAGATISFVLAFGSAMMVRALTMAGNVSPEMVPVFNVLNAILPQYSLFDIGSRAVNIGWSPVPLWVVGALASYMVMYTAATLTLGWIRFRRQAI